jgi:hypothetical protein
MNREIDQPEGPVNPVLGACLRLGNSENLTATLRLSRLSSRQPEQPFPNNSDKLQECFTPARPASGSALL